MLKILKETLVQMGKTIKCRSKRLIEMDKILQQRKDVYIALEKEKTKDMSPEELEVYKKEKNLSKLNSIKTEKQKEADGESIDIFEYHNYFSQHDYFNDLDRNFHIYLGVDLYIKVSIYYIKAIRASKRMQKKELVFNVYGNLFLTHLTTLSTFYLLKAPYKEPDYFFNYIRDPLFLNTFLKIIQYLSVPDVKQILTMIR
jgi:hypothetical protein